MPARIEIITGRIETLAHDAVVNAANNGLYPGTGVDGALRAAAGPELTRHTQTIAPVEDGEAKASPGFNAPARFIIHTCAPRWYASPDEDLKKILLARCYANCIALAGELQLASIAFPCLGTGNFGWPKELACDIALRSVSTTLLNALSLSLVTFCCFSEADAALYRVRNLT